jgi:hypothetical protein
MTPSLKQMMRLLEQIDGKQVVSSGQQVVNCGFSGQQVVSSEQQLFRRRSAGSQQVVSRWSVVGRS